MPCPVLGLKADETVVVAGSGSYGKGSVNSWTDIVAVSAGDLHTVGLKSDGTIAAIGYNSFGQCELDSWKDMAVVLAAQWTTFDLKANGTISTFGYDFCKYDLGGQYDIFNWTDISCHQ